MKNILTNLEIADILRNVSSAYQIKNEVKNKFKIIAYDRAATSIEHLSSEAKDLWDEGKLSEIAGVGDSIAAHIGEIFEMGKSKHFDKVLEGIPPAVFELIKISGIGPKTAMKLSKNLNIVKKEEAFEKLSNAIKNQKVLEIEGFGEKSQKEIKMSLNEHLRHATKKRMLLPYAYEIAENITSWMRMCDKVLRVASLGSLRRFVSTIGDIDIAVSSNDATMVIEHFTAYKNASRILEKGDTTASIILPGNIKVDLMVKKPQVFGSVLQHFTGSKQHNIKLREYAIKNGVSLSENGIKITDYDKSKNLKLSPNLLNKEIGIYEFSDEHNFYGALNMRWIDPEIREDMGEIEFSLQSKLPDLIEIKDIKGDLQIHTNFDVETSHDLGLSSPDEILKMADKLSYEYIAFTEHNPSQRGHNDISISEILKRKKEMIEELNYSLVKTENNSVKKVFNSLEIDILPNGNLPISVKNIELLDFALVSIHSSFRSEKKENTKRVLNALEFPKVKIFAHPTARKINEREGVDLDWELIFEKCNKKDIWLEINADPARLDLPDFLVREAIQRGLKLTLGTDSHHVDHMENMRWGVSVARRGWVQKKDLVNSLGFNKLIDLL